MSDGIATLIPVFFFFLFTAVADTAEASSSDSFISSFMSMGYGRNTGGGRRQRSGKNGSNNGRGRGRGRGKGGRGPLSDNPCNKCGGSVHWARDCKESATNNSSDLLNDENFATTYFWPIDKPLQALLPW